MANGKEETLNMISLTIDQFTQIIREQLEEENYTPVIGIGKSGVGKTESIYELTQELGIGFCELRLVTMTETDLLGIPTITSNGRTTWASNDLLPDEKRDGKRGILVLDEITSCTSTIRAAAYQLLDSKRALGNYKLPDGWLVVALGNGPDDGGVFQGMECAFLSRGVCARIEPDLNTWKKWAINKEINPTVLAYLSYDPDKLHKFNPDEIASVFPCPRSWVTLSKKLNAREAKNEGRPLDQDAVDIYAATCVGAEVATKFGVFYAYNKKTVSASDILDGKATTNIGSIEQETIYIVVQHLVRALNQELKLGRIAYGSYKPEAVQRVANACNWLIAVGNVKLDVAIMAMTDLGKNVKEFADVVLNEPKFDVACPNFIKFAQKNQMVFGSVTKSI